MAVLMSYVWSARSKNRALRPPAPPDTARPAGVAPDARIGIRGGAGAEGFWPPDPARAYHYVPGLA